MEYRRVSIIILILLYLSVLPANIWAVTIIPVVDGTSYNYYYGADDGATRYKCPTADVWRVEAIGGVTVGSSTYSDREGLLIVYMLERNYYKFDNYTLSCYDDNGVRQGTTIYINIIDARRIHISYTYPTHSDTITSSNSTVPYEIPPLAQDIRISCVMEGCGWGNSRTRPVNSYYNISVMSIKENTVITSYYKFFTGAGDTDADIYKLLQISIMATGSTFAIKQSTTSYSLLPAYSSITNTSNITLACATDQTPVVSDSIQWYYTSTDAQNRIASTDNRLSLSKSTGISTLAVVISGTYICRVNVINGSSFRTNEYTILINVPSSSQTTTISTTAKQKSTAIASTTIPTTLQVTPPPPTTTPTTTTTTTTTITTPLTTTTTTPTTTVISTNSILSTPLGSNSTTESILSSTSFKISSTIPETQQLSMQASLLISLPPLGSDSTTVSTPLSLPKTLSSLETPKSSPLNTISQSASQARNMTQFVLQTEQFHVSTSNNAILIASLSIGLLFMVLSVILGVLLIIVSVYYYKAKNLLSACNDIPATEKTAAQAPAGVRSDYEYMQVAGEDSRKYYQIPESPPRADYIDMNSVEDSNLKNDGSKYYVMEPKH